MSFLIVKTSAIGDVIQTFAVVEYLRKRFPDARIDWVVERTCYDLIQAHPYVSQAICVDTKKWRKKPFSKETWNEILKLRSDLKSYDVVFDLQGNTKSAFITLLAKGKEKVGYSFSSVPEKPNLLVTTKRYPIDPELSITERYLKLVQSYFEDTEPFISEGVILKTEGRYFSEPSLMVCFGSKWKNKRLEEKTLHDFLKLIAQEYHPYFIFIWGNEEERVIAQRLQSQFQGEAIGNLSLPSWQALMHNVAGVIAMDSAALHLAATTKTSTFSLFGPSSSKIYKPQGEQHFALQGKCPYGKSFQTRCPILRTCSTGACMHFSAEELFDHFKRWAMVSCVSLKISSSPLSERT